MATTILRNISTSNSNESILSFQEWAKLNVGIPAQSLFQQYELYVLNSQLKKQKSITDSYSLKSEYIDLLKKLKVIFKNDEEFDRLTNINFDDSQELSLVIPFYARKLKEIAIYYSKQREQLKKTKLKYSLVGSTNAIEKILYEYLLNAFTKRDNYPSIQNKIALNSIPELSAISDDFKIEVEELFDMTNYYNSNKAEAYALSSNNPLLFTLDAYINTNYGDISFLDLPLSALSNPLYFESNCESGSALNVENLQLIGSKYIGNDIYYLTGGYYDWDKKDIELPITQGNNFFFWFSGEYVREIPEGQYLDIPLSSINWDNATGSEVVSSADIMLVNVGNVVTEGAWLQANPFITINANMSSTMTDGKIFKFPYPGIGLSAEGLTWSGPSITDLTILDRRFFPSEQALLDTQERIKDLYWNTNITTSACNAILLQNTSLYESGANASNKYSNADKLIIRSNTGADNLHDTNPNEIYTGDLNLAWLYKFSQTQIPIKDGSNNVYFPLTAFNNSEDLTFVYESGDDIVLSAVNVGNSFAGAVAGTTLADADLLIKLNSVCGPELEAAWLCGLPLSSLDSEKTHSCSCEGDYINYYTQWKYKTGSFQPALSFKANAGDFIRFVWTGPKTNINKLQGFTGFVHDDSCEYKKANKFYSLLDTNFINKTKKGLYENWKNCSCKSVLYSPLGHRGQTLDQYKVMPDFIVKDSSYPNKFSYANWVGSDGKNYKTSNDLCWFRASEILEPDMGWGTGQWLTNDDEDFYFEQGQTYMYYRSDINRCGFDLPAFILNSGYCECILAGCSDQSCIPVWKKAILNDSGEWEDAGSITDMVIPSNTFITYKHKDSVSFSKSRLTYKGEFLTGNFVTLSSVDANIGESEQTTKNTALNFLIKIDLNNNNPYWGEGSFALGNHTQNKLLMHGVENSKYVYDYLQINQPNMSDIVLENNSVIEYKSNDCGGCFVWDQPLTFNIKDGSRRWNKIFLDTCVKSDVLNYLLNKSCDTCQVTEDPCIINDICGCSENCYSTKLGVTASYIPSDIILNTELSGIPVFVDYFARNDFTLGVTITNITNGYPPNGGIWVPPVSGIYSKAVEPWKNIINDFYPSVALSQTTYLSSGEELGIFKPSNISTQRYELHDGVIELDYKNRNSNSFDLVRNETYIDGDFILNNFKSEWMKKKGNSISNGIPVINDNQTFYPYTAKNEMNGVFYGLGFNNDGYAPWNKNGDWSDIAKYPYTKTNNPLINCENIGWYSSQHYLTGHVRNWETDIYANEYFLMFNETNPTNIKNPSMYGDLYIRFADRNLYSAKDGLSAVYNKYKNVILDNGDSLSSIFSTNIQNIEVYYNTLVVDFKLSNGNNYVLVEPIKFDYDTNNIKDTDKQQLMEFGNTGTSLPYKTFTGNTYAGSIYKERNKEILICGLSAYQSAYIPTVHKYNINTGILNKLYPNNLDEWSGINNGIYVVNQRPLVSWNPNTNVLNFLYRTVSGATENLMDFELKMHNEDVYINNINTLTASSINTNSFNYIDFKNYGDNEKLVLIGTDSNVIIPLKL